MYQIGIFSKLNHISIKTLRHYDEIGLLKPVKVDTESGYRYYSLNQSYTVHQIQNLKQMGFRLEEIKMILTKGSSDRLFTQKRQQLLTEIAEKNRSLAQLDYYLAKSQRLQNNYAVSVKKLEPIQVAVYETVLENYHDLHQVMLKMSDLLAEVAVKAAKPHYCFTQYIDQEYKETDITVRVCETVDELKPAMPNLTFTRLPTISQAACLFHRGPYNELPQTYALLMDWIEKNHFVPCGLARESYIEGAWNQNSTADWLTEIQMPIERIDPK